MPTFPRVLALAAISLSACGERGDESTTSATGTSTASGDPTSSGATMTMTGDAPSTGEPVTTTGAAQGCRGDADCAPDPCVGTLDGACTECVPHYLQCASDFDCAAGDGCIDYPLACSCDSPFTTACVPLCTTSADCDEGSVCDLDSNHCVYDPCAGDQDCPPLFTCVPVLGGDACRRRSCESDGDCGGAVCIDGLCHAAPGTCVPSPS